MHTNSETTTTPLVSFDSRSRSGTTPRSSLGGITAERLARRTQHARPPLRPRLGVR